MVLARSIVIPISLLFQLGIWVEPTSISIARNPACSRLDIGDGLTHCRDQIGAFQSGACAPLWPNPAYIHGDSRSKVASVDLAASIPPAQLRPTTPPAMPPRNMERIIREIHADRPGRPPQRRLAAEIKLKLLGHNRIESSVDAKTPIRP